MLPDMLNILMVRGLGMGLGDGVGVGLGVGVGVALGEGVGLCFGLGVGVGVGWPTGGENGVRGSVPGGIATVVSMGEGLDVPSLQFPISAATVTPKTNVPTTGKPILLDISPPTA